MTDLTPVFEIIQSFGVAGLLLYLWVQERKRSDVWQERYIHLMERLIGQERSYRTPD